MAIRGRKHDITQKYALLKEKRWHAEGVLMLFSIISLLSYIALAVNVVALVQLNANIRPLRAILVMLVLLSLFAYRQFNLTVYKASPSRMVTFKHRLNIIDKMSNRLAKSVLFLYGFAISVLFYLYATFAYSKSHLTPLVIYVLCAVGIIIYLTGMVMLKLLGSIRERILNAHAWRGQGLYKRDWPER